MDDDVKSSPMHPGKHLAAILDMVGMTRKELSLRTGVSEKYIEMVIHGAKDISFTFARRLEYAVGLSMQQWIDMQAQYDEYRFKQKALAGIHPDELEIPLHLVDVMPHLKRYRLLHEPKHHPPRSYIDAGNVTFCKFFWPWNAYWAMPTMLSRSSR